MTNGNASHKSLSADQLRMVRMVEATSSASLVGASYSALDVDEHLYGQQDQKVVLKLVNTLRHLRPQLVFTHSPQSLNPVKQATNMLLRQSLLAASHLHVHTDAEVLKQMPVIYYMESPSEKLEYLSEYVDISDTLNQKIEALTLHASQVEVMEEKGLQMVREVELLASYRGLQSNVRFAEAFCFASGQRALTKRLLP
jgi:LmbE family N-acetylglucosaminyl deacetylase